MIVCYFVIDDRCGLYFILFNFERVDELINSVCVVIVENDIFEML